MILSNMDVIVYFDLDGVLADMEGGLMQNTELVGLRKILDDLIDTKFTEYKGLVDDDIKSKFKAELEQNPESPVKELKKAFNKYTSKVFSIAAKPGFYANLPLMEGAKEMVAKAKELTGKLPHILSSPVGDENDPTNPSVQEKKDWVKSNFGDMVDKIIITTDKASVVKDKCCLLIDDRPKYVNVFTAAGGSAILHKKSIDTISQMEQLIPKLSSMTENKKWVMAFESFRKNLLIK
jgi:5'(3')-deoxyribonucleotidase